MKLKSFIILLFIIVSVIQTACAQNREFIVGSFLGFYGVHIVGDASEIYSQTGGELAGKGGISAGFNVNRYLAKNTYLGFELRYIRKGSIYEFITSYSTVAYESIVLNYFEIPLIIGYRFNLNKKYLLAETGLAYGRMISSKMEVSELNPWDVSHTIDNFKKNDLSWVANLKYPIIKNQKLLLGFRFSYSLMTIHSIYKLYNMDYGVELYYLFNRNVN